MKKTYLSTLADHSTRILQSCIIASTLFGAINTLSAQTTIYNTDFGTVANVNPSNWTFSGSGMNISTNNASSGYAGASGGACLGEGNSVTFTNTAGSTQTSSPIGTSEAILLVSTTGYSNVALSFGMRKSSSGYNSNATYSLEWSTNGTSYNTITYTEATAGNWDLASGIGLTLPAGAANQANLYLKWTFVRTGTSSNFKIDDVTILGNIPVITPATISFLSNDTTVSESVSSATVFLRLSATSTASSAISVSVSVLSNASGADYSLGVSTVTFAANAPVNSTSPITINLTNDAIAESAEYIILRLSNPQNAVAGSISQFAFYIGDNDKVIPSASNSLSLNLIGSFSNGTSGVNSAEIVAHDPITQRLFIANSIAAKLDIVNFINPATPTLLLSVPVTTYGNINSVAVKNGIVAVAIENSTNPQDSGKVVFFNTDGTFLKQVKVGMMPDMITFNNAGTKVITANEGEPNAAYTNDPDGSVSIIDISGGIAALTQTNVSHITFTVYNGQEATLRAQGIRIFGLNANSAKDFEPEYVTVSPDDSKAWVSLQENNALVEINLSNNSINYIKALGTKDHSLLNNGFDASNVTRGVNVANFPVKGFYLPDAIASYTVGGVNYIISANEGDARAYSGFSEEKRVSALILDGTKFPNGSELKNNYVLGRLTVTDKSGDTDNDGDIDTIYSYGSRSFSIWNANTGNLVYDSKDDLELITSTSSFSLLFNASNSNATRKDRSDDKGPEPEGVAIGKVGSSIYAFIALERIGGVMVYDVTNPNIPVYVTYVNNRSLPSNGPDLGSEGIIFIPQSQSPNGQHIVIAANEISSTLTFWGIPGCASAINSSLSVVGNTANACSNTPPQLSVASSTALTYQWFNGTSLISGATSNTYAPTTSGLYSVAIVGGTNCATGSVARSLTVNPSPTIAVSGATAVCPGAVITQTLSGAASYSYNSVASTSIISFTPVVSGNYTLTALSSSSCSGTSVRPFTVKPLPNITLYTVPSIICSGQSSTLTATGAFSYTWSTGSLSDASIVSPTLTSVYSVTGTVDGCVSSLTKTVVVNPLPVTTVLSSSSLICVGETATLTANGASSYVWSNGSVSNTILVNPMASAFYTVSGTSTLNCSATASITQNVSECTAIQSENLNGDEFNVFPNPAVNEFVISFSQELKVDVKVFNAIGSLVIENKEYVSNSGINISQLAKGIYFVELLSGKTKIIKKIIVE
jgi:hypothetical protein